MIVKVRNKKPVIQNSTVLQDAEYKQVNTEDIDFSPLNYRKFISEDALQQFAEELKQHGIISPLTLRPVTESRYELVAGERRLRAARIAGLSTVPAAIVILTDEQVIEIQLAENLQREDPHPLHEAQAIGQMQRAGKTIDEIATRLGKSKQFVYTRLKLLSLLEPFQEMVFANVISLQDALQIAALSETSQQEFFDEHCIKWKKDKNFRLYNLDYYLNQYRYDLKSAPFNIKDKKLVSEVGACVGCPSNSASLKTLFPDYAKQAVCSNKECYNNKCTLHFLAVLGNAITAYQPEALLYNNELTEMAENIIALIPGAGDLPRYNYHDITVIQKPVLPGKEDYTYDDDEENPEFEEDAYKQAMDDYYLELESYNLHLQSGHYKVAVLLGNKEFAPVHFSLEKPKQYGTGNNGKETTAKQVQEAIKAGKATPELLQSEIDRIKDKEKRSVELDAEKVQLTVHNLLSAFASEPANNTSLTQADMIGARLIVYQSLDYSSREKVYAVLFPKTKSSYRETCEEVFEVISKLTDQQFAYLIRMAICGKSESKYPRQEAGYFLYQIAREAGIPVQAVEDEQAGKAKDRKEKQDLKIQELKNKIKKLKTVRK